MVTGFGKTFLHLEMPGKRNQARTKVTWNYDMNKELIKCRDKAKELVQSETPPKKLNGRKLGYMELMRNMFLEKYPELDYLSSQNLRDQTIQAEKVISSNILSLENVINSERIPILFNNNSIHDNDINDTNDDEGLNAMLTTLTEIECNGLSEANKLFEEIKNPIGDMSKRLWSTKSKKVPRKSDIESVNNICTKLITEHILEIQDPLKIIWIVNCIMYAAIIGWLVVNNIDTTIKTNTGKKFNPKWLKIIDGDIANTRKYISQCVAERNRLSTNSRLTRKMKRNRGIIRKDLSECISVYNLTKLIEKLKAKVHRLVRKRKKKIYYDNSRRWNRKFKEDQKRVYSTFRSIVNENPEDEFPVFKEMKSENNFFNNASSDVEVFWRTLWCKVDVGEPNVEWLNQIESVFEEKIPNVHESDLDINKGDIFNAIRKKRNWSAPGPDYITNFWLKKLTSIHQTIQKAFVIIINQEIMLPPWFCRGKTTLHEKPGGWEISNTRPITCTNNMYKWFTSLVHAKLNKHLTANQLMQVDQRGAVEKCSGTLNNLLIDDMILKDAHDNKKNLSCAWIDVRKAYDSLSHSWLKRILEVHRIPTKLKVVISSIISQWNTVLIIPTKEGIIRTDPIKITNGVLQGDTICPTLYTLSKNPISWHIRRYDGYILSKPVNNKITHSLFIDDLKCYAKSKDKLKNMLLDIKGKMGNAGLEWNMKKCKVMHMKRGKLVMLDGDIRLYDNTIIECLKDSESYKFLGVPESDTHKVSDIISHLKLKVQQRCNIIWSSPLSDYYKVMATNMFAISAVQYYMWSERIRITDLREMDTIIRKILNSYSAKYSLQLNSILYIP